MVAQATLAQMIEGVFQRIPPSLSADAQRKRDEEAAHSGNEVVSPGNANESAVKEQEPDKKGVDSM